IARDITIRKKAEEKLISSEKKVQNLINNISDVLIEVNVDGVFTFTSPQIFKLIESRSEEITNSKFIDLVHPEDLDHYQEAFKTAQISKSPLFLECKIRHKKGYYIPISIRGSFVETNNVNKFFGVISDITERKQIENMIKKEIKTLKDLDKIRNNLVTRMSHELKTPLVSIFSGTEFLLFDYRNQLTEEVKTVISDIHDGGYRLKTMVENLLTVFEIDSEKIKFNPTKENVIQIIKECIEDIILQANKRNISINVELLDNLFLDVDKDLIKKAIFNIISNAVKNTPSNRNVYIRTIEHHIYVEIVIKDTGVGITKKEMVDLFKPFGKIERFGKGMDVDIEGPGLGLYIANEIIKLHEGEIVLRSKGRNKGSTFTIRLNQTNKMKNL
nr:Histidine protein kinase DivJ [Candidatus Anoxychlamydiales bacterium]